MQKDKFCLGEIYNSFGRYPPEKNYCEQALIYMNLRYPNIIQCRFTGVVVLMNISSTESRKSVLCAFMLSQKIKIFLQWCRSHSTYDAWQQSRRFIELRYMSNRVDFTWQTCAFYSCRITTSPVLNIEQSRYTQNTSRFSILQYTYNGCLTDKIQYLIVVVGVFCCIPYKKLVTDSPRLCKSYLRSF